MRIFVTGASGFVGINTVRFLEKKYDVVALVRDKNKVDGLFRNAILKEGDITDKSSLYKAIDNYVDAVVHIAGMINASDLKSLYSTNRYGCKNMADVCRERGITNIVYVSSLAARGPDGCGYPISHYGFSKRFGELEFLKLFYDKGIKIIRPPIIYGPYDRGFFDLFKMAKRGILPYLKREYSLVYIDDLTKAIELLIKLNLPKPKIYYISGSKADAGRINRALFDAFSKKGIQIPIPDAVVDIFSFFKFDSKAFSKDKIREIKAKAFTCDNTELFNDTAFKPEVEIENGFRITARWYESNGWL